MCAALLLNEMMYLIIKNQQPTTKKIKCKQQIINLWIYFYVCVLRVFSRSESNDLLNIKLTVSILRSSAKHSVAFFDGCYSSKFHRSIA